MSHLAVPKTYKLFIGGAFPRSESGRTYQARDSQGNFMANAALASRKDLRDAVVAARKGSSAWSEATAYNRGQVIYRIAEMLEGRSSEFVELIMISTGTSTKIASAEVDAAIDRLVHYAGWTDKLAAVLGSANPVSSPYFSYSAPAPRPRPSPRGDRALRHDRRGAARWPAPTDRRSAASNSDRVPA